MSSAWLVADGQIRIRKFSAGPLDTNVYVVADPSGEAVIIDAAADADRILREVADLRPRAVLTTHGHWDHVGAADVAERLDIPWRIHPEDAALAGRRPDLPLRDGEIIELGTVHLTTLHTPGHSPGSICFLTGGHLFSGDTLFPGGPGATTGPGADFATIMRSLHDRLFVLPDTTVVYPGHGPNTTIGTERPALPEWEARGW